MTNDGELAHRLMKAASHVAKTYVVKVAGTPKEEAIAKLRAGVSIATDDGKRVKTGPALVRVVKEAANPWYEITLIEGRNRQIRRMFEAVGHHVEKIKRVRYGPLSSRCSSRTISIAHVEGNRTIEIRQHCDGGQEIRKVIYGEHEPIF